MAGRNGSPVTAYVMMSLGSIAMITLGVWEALQTRDRLEGFHETTAVVERTYKDGKNRSPFGDITYADARGVERKKTRLALGGLPTITDGKLPVRVSTTNPEDVWPAAMPVTYFTAYLFIGMGTIMVPFFHFVRKNAGRRLF